MKFYLLTKINHFFYSGLSKDYTKVH